MRSKVLPALLVLFILLPAFPARGQTNTLPSLPDTKITLPWDRFVEMIRGTDVTPPATPPPVDIAVGRASYTMRLSPGRLESSIIIEAPTYGNGWHELFIAGRDTPLVSLSVDGKDALTIVRADGVYVALEGAGTRMIHAAVACDAPETPGPHTVTISGPSAAVRGVDLSYPRHFVDVDVGGVVMTSVPGRVSSVLSGDGGITVSYTAAPAEIREAPGKTAAGPPEIIAEVLSVLDIGEEAVRLSVRVGSEVRNAPERSFRVRLPMGFDLLDVTGDGISSWKVSDDGRELTVTVGYDVIGAYAFDLSFEMRTTDTIDTVLFPTVTPVGAVRTTGFIAVVSGGGFEVTEKTAERLTPRDPSELPDAIFSLSTLPPVLAYRFTDPGYALAVAVGKGEALSPLAAFVDSANSVVLVTADGKMVVRTNYFVRNRSLQFLKITLPPKSVFWSATVRGTPTKTATDRDGVVMIPLPMGSGAATEPFVVSVVIFVPVPEIGFAGRPYFELPRLEIPAGEVMATFYLPETASYLSFGGDMEAIEYFTEVLSSDASESFVTENLKLRKAVYERQEDLERAINEQEQMPEKGGAGLPPAPEGFDLPLRGKSFRFVKLIVMGEETGVSAVYVDRRAVIVIVMLLAVLIGVLILRYRHALVSVIAGLRHAGKR